MEKNSKPNHKTENTNYLSEIDNNFFLNRQKLFQEKSELNPSNTTEEKNNEKLSLRKKKNQNLLMKKRKAHIQNISQFNQTIYSINYEELINQIPINIKQEFTSSKSKYYFYLKYISISNNDDPSFIIRMFIIYQILQHLNNDKMEDNMMPSPELIKNILQLFVQNYDINHLNQKYIIQSEILKIFIILSSYSDEDNTNSFVYEDQFQYYLYDILNDDTYEIGLKINILILFDNLIKGRNTFDKIIGKFEIFKIIEKILENLKSYENFIQVFKLINTIFSGLNEYYEDENEHKLSIINNLESLYNKILMIFIEFYENYKKLYEESKNEDLFLTFKPNGYYLYKNLKIIFSIINNSMFLDNNELFIKSLLSNNKILQIFLEILEKYITAFSQNDPSSKHIQLINNIRINTNANKNIIYKKTKIIIYITHILTEIISFSNLNENIKNYLLYNVNFLNYYTNLTQNIFLSNVSPDQTLILRITELIFNLCVDNKKQSSFIFHNYSEIIKVLFELSKKFYNKENFKLLITLINDSISLFDEQITKTIINKIHITNYIINYLKEETTKSTIDKEVVEIVLYLMYKLLDSETYKKCKFDRMKLVYEFQKANAYEIILQYSELLSDDDYEIITAILVYLDYSDNLTSEQVEKLYNYDNGDSDD